MNNRSNFSINHTKSQFDYAKSEKGVFKSIIRMVKGLFESAEHAARITVVILVISLMIFSITKVVETEILAGQFCDMISEMVYTP